MIPINQQPEPPNFSRDVRTPGQAFLGRLPTPTIPEIRKENYWRHCHDDLHRLYAGICAYSAQWTLRAKRPVSVEHSSVDHYIPISINPGLAYEWDNYRLARARMNHNKANSTCVVDPFTVQHDWFTINFRTFLIRPNDDLPTHLEQQIEDSITQLDLNHNDFVEERMNVLKEYSKGMLTLPFLDAKYPFIAYELRRQGELQTIMARLAHLP
jgi:hypothetical protein